MEDSANVYVMSSVLSFRKNYVQQNNTGTNIQEASVSGKNV